MGLLKHAPLCVILFTATITASMAGATEPTWQSGRRMGLNGIYKRVYVDIWNRMPAGMELTSHCQSGDDDLGIRGAGTDVAISFDIQPNWYATTLYYCEVTSQYGAVKFDVYDFNRDYGERCETQCTWNVMNDGVHGVNQKTQVADVFYAWWS